MYKNTPKTPFAPTNQTKMVEQQNKDKISIQNFRLKLFTFIYNRNSRKDGNGCFYQLKLISWFTKLTPTKKQKLNNKHLCLLLLPDD
jgi:hypothetical protein